MRGIQETETETRAKHHLTFAGWPKPSTVELRICHPYTPNITKLLLNARPSLSCTPKRSLRPTACCRLSEIGLRSDLDKNIQSALAVLGLPKRPSLPSSRKNPLPDRVKPFFIPFLTIVRSAMTATIRIAKVAKG